MRDKHLNGVVNYFLSNFSTKFFVDYQIPGFQI